jgi:tetrahedral aminopeptidase
MNIDLLKQLCETPGVPGREERVRAFIENEIAGLFDEVRTDAMGSLICTRHPRKKGKPTPSDDATKILLLCHMDEIGFYIRHIDDNGFLRVNPAGGFDTRNLFSRRVLVCTRDNGDLPGVMNPGGKPIHIASPEDRKKVPEIGEFFIDLGFSVERVREMVTIGDMVVLNEPFMVAGEKVVSKALDNRIACWLGIESVRAIEKAGADCAASIIIAFTVQEEVGLRGAKTASFGVNADIGIGLDVTLACDTPGVPEEDRVTKQGAGAGLHIMDASIISDYRLVDELEAVAKAKGIDVQRTILPRGGQDGAAAQQVASGSRAMGLVVGTRYIHTVTEMADQHDIAAACDLLAAWMPTVA